MKTLLALTLVLFAARSSQSQSCDTLVTEGRGFLVTSNLIAAKARFAQAVVACPDHAAARALLAATRLAAFVHEPAGSNFLNRLGIPGAGRSLYEWTAKMPVDATGLPLTPPEVATGDDVTAFVRTSVLPVLQASEQDLAAVADPGFLLHLAAAETKLAEVTVDYGDVLLLRSLLSFAEFLSYSVHSWDLRAQWGVLRSLHTARTLSAERVLAEYPELFRFSTTTDQEAAKQAFARGADLYMQASGLIRTRPPDQIRLFNTDSDSLEPERDFRELLIDLKDSLERPVVLRQSPGLRVYLARFFDASNSPRSWLPDFRENGVLLGTLPQPLTGGLIQQATRSEAELFLGRFLPLSPNLARSPDYGNAGFHGDFFGLPGQSYTFEASSDLNSWMQIGQGLMQEEAASFTDAAALTLSRRFYRARETGRPLNDDFNQRVPLHGLPVVALGSSVNASRELGEPNHNQFGPPVPQTVWWSWTAPSSTPVLISVENSSSYQNVWVYTGESLVALARLSPTLDQFSTVQFQSGAGVTYQIAVGGPYGGSGRIRLEIQPFQPPPNDAFAQRMFIAGTPAFIEGTNWGATREEGEPVHSDSFFENHSVWWSWRAPVSGRHAVIRGAGDNNSYTVYQGTSLSSLAKLAGGDDSASFEAVAGMAYQIAVHGCCGYGLVRFELKAVTAPPNDAFANRALIMGSTATVSSSNLGATLEPGETDPPNPTGGNSIWWTWTAPHSGTLTLDSSRSDFACLVGIYRGDAVGALELLAFTNGFGPQGAALVLNVSGGATYHFKADGYKGEYGSIVLDLALSPP